MIARDDQSEAALAQAVKNACRQAALEAHEDALIRGLCAQGAFEVAMGAISSLDCNRLLAQWSGDMKKQHAPRVVEIKRVHEPATAGDGVRVLVDRLWPRGVSKEAAGLDEWFKDLAPSPQLRKWFNHDPERWNEFQRRYRSELDKRTARVDVLAALGDTKKLTLLYAAKDEAFNNAVVLCDYLIKRQCLNHETKNKETSHGQ